MLGVDLVGGDSAKHMSRSKKADEGFFKSDQDYKEGDGEEFPEWQNEPAIPELHASIDGNGSSLKSNRYVPLCGVRYSRGNN